MKTHLLAVCSALLLILSPPSRGVLMTFDFFQAGFTDGATLAGEIKVTDVDGNFLISPPDLIAGSLILRVPDREIDIPLNLPHFIRGFDVNSFTGALGGSFTITGTEVPAGEFTVTESGGTVIALNTLSPRTFRTFTTTQAPVITFRVPDSGSAFAMLALSVLMLAPAHLTASRARFAEI